MKKRKNIANARDFKNDNGEWVASYMVNTPDTYIQYQTRSYVVWRSINTRISDKFKAQHPTYKDSSCLFKDYQELAEWCQSQYGYLLKDNNGDHWSLDKDLLVIGNKDYSPETCVFVPHRINKLMTICDASRGKYPLGVSWDSASKKFSSACQDGTKSVRLGRFIDPTEAHRSWQLFKAAQIIKVSQDEILPENVKQALLRRAVKIQEEYDSGVETFFV